MENRYFNDVLHDWYYSVRDFILDERFKAVFYSWSSFNRLQLLCTFCAVLVAWTHFISRLRRANSPVKSAQKEASSCNNDLFPATGLLACTLGRRHSIHSFRSVFHVSIIDSYQNFHSLRRLFSGRADSRNLCFGFRKIWDWITPRKLSSQICKVLACCHTTGTDFHSLDFCLSPMGIHRKLIFIHAEWGQSLYNLHDDWKRTCCFNFHINKRFALQIPHFTNRILTVSDRHAIDYILLS